jgi:putative spermidine/putrescine transport system permease protein
MDRSVASALPQAGQNVPRPDQRERNRGFAVAVLAAPALLFMVLLFLYPLWNLIGLSVDLPHFELQYYRRFVTSRAYVDTALWTLGVCVFITACCLVLGYPTALFLSKAARRGHGYLLALVVFPYLTSLLVRTYAWMVLLSDEGPINQLLVGAGLVSHPVKLLFSTSGAMIGMVHLMLPLMVLPLYSVMYAIPEAQMRAAAALGGGPVRSFLKVLLPQSLPGIRSGCTLVFAISLGFYITPAALGSPRDTMLSNLIASLIGGALDFKFAAAISVLMLAATLAFYFLVGGGLGSLRQDSGGAAARRSQRWSCFGSGVVANSALAARLGRALWSGRVGRPRALPYFGSSLLAAYSGAVLLFLVTPSIMVIVMSFSGEDVLGFPPHSWSLRWYSVYFGDPTWLTATWVSFKIASLSTALALLLGIGAAYAFVRGPRWLRNPGYALLLAPLMVPSVVMAVGLFGVLAGWGLLGTTLGILLAHTTLGISYVVIIVGATLMGLDRRLELASMSLGASHFRTTMRVIVPLIMPGIVAAGIFAFINSFDEVVVTSFLASLRIETLPLKIWEDIRYAIDPTVAAISAMLIMLPLVALPFVRRRGGPIQF